MLERCKQTVVLWSEINAQNVLCKCKVNSGPFIMSRKVQFRKQISSYCNRAVVCERKDSKATYRN